MYKSLLKIKYMYIIVHVHIQKINFQEVGVGEIILSAGDEREQGTKTYALTVFLYVNMQVSLAIGISNRIYGNSIYY